MKFINMVDIVIIIVCEGHLFWSIQNLIPTTESSMCSSYNISNFGGVGSHSSPTLSLFHIETILPSQTVMIITTNYSEDLHKVPSIVLSTSYGLSH